MRIPIGIFRTNKYIITKCKFCKGFLMNRLSVPSHMRGIKYGMTCAGCKAEFMVFTDTPWLLYHYQPPRNKKSKLTGLDRIEIES